MAEWRTVKVRLDYHVSVESQYYSVPYEFIRKQVQIRLSENLVEIFFNHIGIASHARLSGKLGQFATIVEHMPDNHRLYLEQTPENARQWAEEIGEQTVAIVEYLLESYPVEKQALSAIFTLKNSERKYTKYEIERACKEVHSVSLRPTVKLIQNQLKANKKQELLARKEQQDTKSEYGFTRGAAYWEDK